MSLRDFLRSYLDWIEQGAPEGQPFTRREGLCDQCKDLTVHMDLINALMRDHNGDHILPFQAGGAYHDQSGASTQHTNRMRLAWVSNTLAILEAPETVL